MIQENKLSKFIQPNKKLEFLSCAEYSSLWPKQRFYLTQKHTRLFSWEDQYCAMSAQNRGYAVMPETAAFSF